MIKTIYEATCWTHLRILMRIVMIMYITRAFYAPTSATNYDASIIPRSPNSGTYHSLEKHLVSEMDTTVDPCDNFYQFSCGNFIKSTNVKSEFYRKDKFITIEAQIIINLYSAMKNLNSSNTFRPFKMIKNFYDTCMDTSNIEILGYKPLIKILKTLDSWPLMPALEKKQVLSWEEIMYKTMKIGYSGDFLLGLAINADSKNISRLALYINEPQLEFSREQFSKGLSDTGVQAYYTYMIDVAEVLGVKRERAKKELLDVLYFEIELSKIVGDYDDTLELYKPMKIADLKKKWPRINWNMFMRIINLYVTLDNTDTVIITNSKFITAFENLIDATPPRVQKNYISWKIIEASVPYLNNKLQKKLTMYTASRDGVIEKKMRWTKCVQIVQDKLKLAVDSLYIRNYIKGNTKKRISYMVDGIRDELLNIINKVNWLDKKSIINIKENIENMTSVVAYADELVDDKKLEYYFEDLKLDSSYLQNWLNINTFMMKKVCQSLKIPFNYSDWTILDTWTKVNARYLGYANRLEIPAGILHYPFYANNRPNYMNYGSIGSIIGHELFHNLDNEYKLFVPNSAEPDWDMIFAKRNYLKKISCLFKQYNNYTVKEIGKKINGITSIEENISDNGGIRLAYQAYQKWVAKYGQELKLPNLPYTPNQLFWISTANTWCSVYSPKVLERINGESHIPNEFRMIGALSNIPEFSADFNCSVESNMNRLHKCQFW